MYLQGLTLNTGKENDENKYQQPEVDDYTPEGYDELISAEVLIPKGDQSVLGTVIGRKCDSENKSVVIRNANPILDTREYDVMLPDGSTVAYNVNSIVKNIYSQVDADCRQYSKIEEIVNHARDHTALDKKDGFIISHNGKKIPKKITRGWKLLIKRKDELCSWIPLKDIKASNPIEVAEYAIHNGIEDELP